MSNTGTLMMDYTNQNNNFITRQNVFWKYNQNTQPESGVSKKVHFELLITYLCLYMFLQLFWIVLLFERNYSCVISNFINNNFKVTKYFKLIKDKQQPKKRVL